MVKSSNVLLLQYRDWRQLSLHLLWSYDDDRKLLSGKNARKGVRLRRQSHQSECSAALLVRGGWVEVEHDGKLFRAEPGEWLIVKPGQRTQRLSDDVHLLSVVFEATWLDGRPLISDGLSCVIPAASYPLLEKQALKIIRCLDEIAPDIWNAKDEVTSYWKYLTVQAALAMWLEALIQTLSINGIIPELLHSSDERVMRAVRILEAHPLSESIKLEELADQVGISPNSLRSLFKLHLGKTPAVFRNDLKLDYAKRTLTLPDTRAKEVAIDLGFKHLSQFSRWFKMQVGSSPREYASSHS